MAYPSAATAACDIARVVRDPETRLTNDILELHAQSGCATEGDLKRRGWRAESIARYIDAARERAQAHLDGPDPDGEDVVAAEPAPPRRPTRPRTTPAPSWPQRRRGRA